jgi:NADH-quinone oxidoreductase subunit K
MTATLLRHALLLSAALFIVGAVGVVVRRNVITVLMCLELMLNAANLALVAFNRVWGTLASPGRPALDGQVLVFFVLTVAAAEAAVGLAIVIALTRRKDTLDVDAFDLMKG